MLATLSLISCSDDTTNDDVNAPKDDVTDDKDNDNSNENGELDNITDIDPDIMNNSTTIHMIQSVDRLENWRSGKTVYDVFFYVDDMTELLDSLEWQSSDEIDIVEDFHFRIDIERPIEEIADFEKFLLSEEPPLDTVFTVSEGHEELGVQYLINFDENVVNMKLSSYSSQVFNVSAELDESQMKILELCLKAYFGPHDK